MRKLLSLRAVPLFILVAVSALIVGLDQLTKYWVVVTLPEGHWWSPLPGNAWRIFRITHTTNSGAAFGIFPQQGGVFILIAVVVVVAIVLYYRHLPQGDWLIRVSLGLQLGGAIGNLIDRLRFGYVVDFIDVGFFPIFNIADASITIGVVLIAFSLWRSDRAMIGSRPQLMDEEVHS
jgi:signal peptidase II